MFCFSAGFLYDALITPHGLFEAASNNKDSAIVKTVAPKPILHVVKIDVVRCAEDLDKLEQVTLTLNDSETTSTALLHKNSWSMLSTYLSVDEQDKRDWTFLKERKLRDGVVIILNSYCYQHNDDDTNIVLMDLDVIGYNSQPSRHLEHQPATKEDKQSYLLSSIGTHSLKDLTINLTNWKSRVYITKFTNISTFTRPNGLGQGQWQRFQIRDISGQAEGIVFNEMCDDPRIQSIKVNTLYMIENGKIKKASLNRRAWASEFNLTIDIEFTKDTSIIPFEKNCDDFNLICNRLTDDQSPSDTSIEMKASTSASALVHPARLQSGITKLQNLCFRKKGDHCDVLGIIIQIDSEVSFINPKRGGREMEKRNLKIVDDTAVEMMVALWGKQAVEFSMKKGEMILFKKIQVSDYQKISLNVYRVTTMLKMSKLEMTPMVKSLWEWWEKINYLIYK